MKIQTQVYPAVRPHIEYAYRTWSAAARTNLRQLTIAPSAGLRIITCDMKTTAILEMEGTAGLMTLVVRREDKRRDKVKEMKSRPSPFALQV